VHLPARCRTALRQLRQIRRLLPTTTFQSLVVALIHTQLDYGNSVLVSLSAYLVRQLQSVLNAAPQLVYNLKRSDHITHALVSFHWLHAPERIKYKVAVLMYMVINGSAPQYLGTFERIADQPAAVYVSALLPLIAYWCRLLGSPPSAAVHSRSPVHNLERSA
jgi:hypothetical protein